MTTITEKLNSRDPLLRKLLSKYSSPEKLSQIKVNFTYSTITVESCEQGDFDDTGFCDFDGEDRISSRIRDLDRDSYQHLIYSIPAICDLYFVETAIDDEDYTLSLDLEYDYEEYTLVDYLKSFLELGSGLEASIKPINDECSFTVTNRDDYSKSDILSTDFSLHIKGLDSNDYQVIYELLKLL